MKKAPTRKTRDELRPEYDLSKLRGGVRGKYLRQAMAGSNVVLIDPDLSTIFPDAESVNRALRALADAAKKAGQRPRARSNRRMQPTRGKAARG
jgi:hypothetical protein